MRLYDLAKVIRSKNAGPFTLALDLMFRSAEDLDRVLAAEGFTAERIAALYRADPATVAVRPFRRVLAIKVTLPRPVGSGGASDPDVYGSQQHFPLAEIEV